MLPEHKEAFCTQVTTGSELRGSGLQPKASEHACAKEKIGMRHRTPTWMSEHVCISISINYNTMGSNKGRIRRTRIEQESNKSRICRTRVEQESNKTRTKVERNSTVEHESNKSRIRRTRVEQESNKSRIQVERNSKVEQESNKRRICRTRVE